MEPTSSLDACKIKKRSERVCVFRVFFFFFFKEREREEKGTVGLVRFGMNFWKTKRKRNPR